MERTGNSQKRDVNSQYVGVAGAPPTWESGGAGRRGSWLRLHARVTEFGATLLSFPQTGPSAGFRDFDRYPLLRPLCITLGPLDTLLLGPVGLLGLGLGLLRAYTRHPDAGNAFKLLHY